MIPRERRCKDKGVPHLDVVKVMALIPSKIVLRRRNWNGRSWNFEHLSSLKSAERMN
jgi:hypothetical protein